MFWFFAFFGLGFLMPTLISGSVESSSTEGSDSLSSHQSSSNHIQHKVQPTQEQVDHVKSLLIYGPEIILFIYG